MPVNKRCSSCGQVINVNEKCRSHYVPSMRYDETPGWNGTVKNRHFDYCGKLVPLTVEVK